MKSVTFVPVNTLLKFIYKVWAAAISNNLTRFRDLLPNGAHHAYGELIYCRCNIDIFYLGIFVKKENDGQILELWPG